MNLTKQSKAVCLGLALGTSFLAAPTMATEGMFALGYSTSQRAMGGTGVAYGFESMSAAVNPANAAQVGHQFQLGVDLFSPRRGYTNTLGAPGLPAPGTFESDSEFFPVPNISYNKPLANGNVLNISAWGNGGMNTDFSEAVFGIAPTGIDLSQLFISTTYAGTSGNLSWGIGPTLAIQTFKAEGLANFGVTGTERDWSYGGGLRAGILYQASPTISLGLSGQTKMYMTKLDEWATLFENAGDFDIPASVTAGIAWKANPALVLMLDVQRIFYSGVPAISNAGPPTIPPPFGTAGGPGFGWSDINVIKLGMELKAGDQMTWRAGYAYSENPIGPEDVGLGVLAPGIMTHHVTAGGTYALSASNEIDFAIEYAPENSVTGGPLTIRMEQISLSVGWTHNF